jgi:hypothetical protein
MRLRNIMLDSGTPFCISKEIAWTAELPRNENFLLLIKMSYDRNSSRMQKKKKNARMDLHSSANATYTNSRSKSLTECLSNLRGTTSNVITLIKFITRNKTENRSGLYGCSSVHAPQALHFNHQPLIFLFNICSSKIYRLMLQFGSAPLT